jgi:hypothetical protein
VAALLVAVLLASACSSSGDGLTNRVATAASTIAFVQANFATPQGSFASVTATYTSAQQAGDSNVVVVGWNDATHSVTSVVDSVNGGTYQLAVPVARSANCSQAIYFLPNVKAAANSANTVTVAFDGLVPSPDLRIVEYSGLSGAVEAPVSATGTGGDASAGPMTTTAAPALVFGAGYTTGSFGPPGSGFAERLFTVPDGDIVEDMVVSQPGSYTATAPQNGEFVFQAVVFESTAGGPPDAGAPDASPDASAPDASSDAPRPDAGLDASDATMSDAGTGNLATLVQHVSSSNTRASNFPFGPTFCYYELLPGVTTAGNAVVVGFTFNGNPTPSVTDDGGNAYTIAANSNDSSSGRSVAIATAFHVVAGARKISVCFSADPGGAVQPMATELSGVVGLDGPGAGNSGFGTVVTAGNLTPSTPGDGVYQIVTSLSVKQSSFTAGALGSANATLLSADLRDGWAGQYGIYASTAAVDPTMSMGSTDSWLSAAILLKSGPAGGVPPGLRVVHLVHENLPVDTSAGGNTGPFSNPTPLQLPCSGNLLVAMIGGGSGADVAVTSITDTAHNTWTQAGTTHQGFDSEVETYYAPSATCRSDLGLTVTWSDTGGDQTILFYDVAGAAASPLDTTVGGTGSQNSVGDLLLPFSLTPATPNEIVFSNVMWDFNTAGGLTGQLFDANTFDGENMSGPEPVDENNGWGHVITSSTAPLHFNWTQVFGGIQVGSWSAMAAAFKGAGGSGDTQPPSVPTNLAATPSSSSVALTWTASTDNVGVAGYGVYRCQGAGCTPSVQLATSPTPSFSDTGLLPSTTYVYAVTAFDAAGNVSAKSAAVSATTSAPVDGGTSQSASFVQVNAATPQSPLASVAVGYKAPEQAGDMNVVVVGWNNGTGAIGSVTDSSQNTYSVAASVTRSQNFSQAIYFAPNVKGGADTITVTFSTAVAFPDVRILEYAGLGPMTSVLQAAGTAGTNGTASAGPVVTDGPGELVFAAGTTLESFSGAGSGFTSRIITQPDADIAEELVPAQPGSFTASATGGQPEWVMQVVSFH